VLYERRHRWRDGTTQVGFLPLEFVEKLAALIPAPRAPRTRNYAGAELMRRVFAVDVLECRECRGRMHILAAIHSWSAIRAIPACLGLPARPPPIAPPDPDPGRLDIDAVG